MGGTPHVLVLSTSPRGSLAPTFYWSMGLAQQGILVTLVSLKKEIDKLISEQKSEVDKLKSFRTLGLTRPQGKEIVEEKELALGTLLKQSFEEQKIVERLAAAPERPTCVVGTMFVSWAKQVASDLQIPGYYTLLGAGATLARFIQASRGVFFRGGPRIRNDELVKEGQIDSGAGVPKMKFQEFPFLSVIPPLHMQVLEFLEGADGVLLNTFHDLEPQALDALRKFKSKSSQKFYAVGPLVPVLSNQPVTTVDEGKLNTSEDEVLRWLDKQPHSSVVYVCLGTMVLHGDVSRFIKEIALGLENSKHRFIWVLVDTATDHKPYTDHLPEGFEARVGDFGKIVKGWASQVEILSHSSTGGFITHCGWNSVLEAVTREVPLITFPGPLADQKMNSRYLVDEIKVAVELRRDANDVPEATEVERVVRHVLEGEEGKAIKGRMQVLRAAGAAALEAGGSTIRARQEFVEDVRNL